MMTAEQIQTTGVLATSLARPVVRPSDLRVGLHPNYPHDDYHYRELGVSSHTANEQFRQSPAHYFAWAQGTERPETLALRIGKAAHMRCLEPARFARTYVIAPPFGDCRYKAAKDARDAWRKEHAGATILEDETGRHVLGMIESVANHAIARGILEGAFCEATVRWTDAATGLPCKCRPDAYRESLETAADIKTTADASPDGFRRAMVTYGYHRQRAHYMRGLIRVGAPIRRFLFIAVEKTPPYAVAVYSVDPEAAAAAERQVENTLRGLADCLIENKFPAYGDSIMTLSLPPWAKDEA